MTTHDIDIELPPLPEAHIVSYQTDSTMRRMELRTYSGEDMKAYARAAIEADRKRRGEPEYLISACYFPGHDEVELTWERKSDGAKAALTCKVTPEQGKQIANVVWPCVYHAAAPQPAEPVVVDHGETRANIGLEAETGSDLGGVVDHGGAEPGGYVHTAPDDCETLHWRGQILSLNELATISAEPVKRRGEPVAWQPIETAPHDVPVLLGWRDWDGAWLADVAPATWGWRTDSVSNISQHGRATHWMPIPPQPAEPADGKRPPEVQAAWHSGWEAGQDALRESQAAGGAGG